MRFHRIGAMAGAIVCAALAAPAARIDAQDSAPPADARTWIGHAAEIEAYLRTATIVKLEDLSVGVTKPKKATLAPGGPAAYFAWKPIAPGLYGGAYESYKSEIAAYEFDKLLDLNMVPPVVERVERGVHGAAIMWVSPTKNFKELGGNAAPVPPARYMANWTRQIVRAKMFDNLIENIDPNLGNWLADPAWNIILIDHSRCFMSDRNLVHTMTHIDPDLWAKMLALTEDGLRTGLRPWLENGQVRAMIQRRDRMKQVIDQMVKEKGEAFVFMRDGGD